MNVEVPAIDDAREPGMTDEQLKAKIERQLRAHGFDGEVTIHGDEVEVRVRREIRK